MATAPPTIDSAASTQPERAKRNPNQEWDIPGDHPDTSSIHLDGEYLVNGLPFGMPSSDQTPIELRSGDKVRFKGRGLKGFFGVGFLTEIGKVRVRTVFKTFGTEGAFEFEVPELDQPSGIFKIQMRHQDAGLTKTLGRRFGYTREKKEDKNKAKSSGGDAGAGEGAVGGSGRSGDTGQLADLFVDQAIGVVGEGAKAALGIGQGGQAQPAKQEVKKPVAAKAPAPAKTETKKTVESEDDAEVTEETQVTSKALPTTIKQSAELVGEFIDKNPGVIANTQVRAEIGRAHV